MKRRWQSGAEQQERVRIAVMSALFAAREVQLEMPQIMATSEV